MYVYNYIITYACMRVFVHAVLYYCVCVYMYSTYSTHTLSLSLCVCVFVGILFA